MPGKELAALQAKLDQLGYSVVPDGDGFRLKLPLFASLAVQRSQERVLVKARFGSVSASTAICLTLALATAFSVLPLGASFSGDGVATRVVAIGVWAGYVLLLGVAFDLMRLTIVDGARTRIELLISLHSKSPPANAEVRTEGAGPGDRE